MWGDWGDTTLDGRCAGVALAGLQAHSLERRELECGGAGGWGAAESEAGSSAVAAEGRALNVGIGLER